MVHLWFRISLALLHRTGRHSSCDIGFTFSHLELIAGTLAAWQRLHDGGDVPRPGVFSTMGQC